MRAHLAALLVSPLALAVLLVADEAPAWGIGPPVGPTGAALSCTGDEHEEQEAPAFRVAASATWVATDVLLGDADVALRRQGLVASLEYRLADDWTLSAGGGVTLAGDLLVGGDRYDIGAGPVGQAGVAYRVLDGDGWEPFLLLGASFAASTAGSDGPISGPRASQSAEEQLTAVDARFSLTLGETFAEAFAPYITLRAFGGPIFWTLDGQDVTGGDKRHFQFGGGFITTTGLLDAYVEIIPLGERSASFGAAVSF